MRTVIFIICSVLILLIFSCSEGSFVIDKNNISSISIVVPDTANSVVHFTADELRKHLGLIFGGDIQITGLSDGNRSEKKIFVGIKPKGFKRGLNPEESVYVISKKSIYIFGDDAINMKFTEDSPGELKDRILSEVLNMTYNRTGTLFALYNFLENELGVRWLKPGDAGIFFKNTDVLRLELKEHSWTPPLLQRNIRTGGFSYDSQLLYGKYAPEEFQLTEKASIKKQTDVMIWLRRMRMGRSVNYRFGHAFTGYWEKYKDSHPDIFALNGKGERKPVGRIERVKMCPTNPGLPGIIIDEWLESVRMNPGMSKMAMSVSGCENDSDGHGNDEWCHCPQCMQMDSRAEGEELTDYVTDRYVYLWNKILKEARKHSKDIMVTGYAYENMLKPPRSQRLDDGLLIEFIPRMGADFEITRKLYEGWRNAGMKMMMYRPNDMNWEIGIPLGQEQRLFENFRLAVENNAAGTDFDSMLGFWDGISDLAYYIISKGQFDLNSSFGQLEDEFLSCFGEAEGDVAQYYRHWRNIFNDKIMKEELRLNDGINTYFLEWARLYRLTERIDEFYSEKDFNLADSLLSAALSKNISTQARKYIEQMKISNLHSLMTFKCFVAGRTGDKKNIKTQADNLIRFRISNKDRIDLNWNTLFWQQHYQMHDQIGTRYLGFLPRDLNSDNF